MTELLFLRLVFACSILLIPLVGAQEDEFCDLYTKSACDPSMNKRDVQGNQEDALCKCFVRDANLCCDMHGEGGNLDIYQSGPYDSVYIGNSPSVTFTPTCGLQQTVVITNVADATLLHNTEYAGPHCLLDLKVTSSNVDYALGYERVELFESTITRISDSNVLRSLTMYNSYAETVSNITVAASGTNNAECISMYSPRIHNLNNVVVKCDAHIDIGQIGTINGTHLSHSRIFKTYIEEISESGLFLQHGWHKLVNVTIKHVGAYGIYFQPYTNIDLQNFEIINCEMPCIVSNTEFVHFNNLFINGNEIEDIGDTNFIEISDFPPRKLFDISSSLCSTNIDSVTCTSDSSIKYQVMEFQPEFSIARTKLSEFWGGVGLSSHCFKELALDSSKGWIRNLRPDFQSNDHCYYEERRIVIKDCKPIDFLQSDYLDRLDVDESEIEFLDITSELSKVQVSNSKIHMLENLEYMAKPGMKSDFNMHGVTIYSLHYLHLKAPGHMQDFFVPGTVDNFTLETSPNAVTSIRHGILGALLPGGINIASGVLMLENVQIQSMNYKSINIKRYGKLLIVPSEEELHQMQCAKGPTILAERNSQVVFLYPAAKPQWLRDCTRTSLYEDSSDMAQLKMKFNHFVTDEECRIVDRLATCDMQNMEGLTLLGGTTSLDAVSRVVVKNVANLTIGENCFDEIDLHRVVTADIMDVKNSCYFKLFMFDVSSILNVVNNVYLLDGEQSFIESLAPSTIMTKASVTDGSIRTLSATIERGVFRNVNITTVHKLTVLKEVIFKNCNITNFMKGSVRVGEGSILRFENCFFNTTNLGSFVIDGSIQMKNVTINTAANGTLSLATDAKVTMERVSIRNSVPDFFSLDSPPLIRLNMVLMEKSPVDLYKRYDVSLSYHNGTLVGQGLHVHAIDALLHKYMFCVTVTQLVIVILLTAFLAIAGYIGFRYWSYKTYDVPRVDASHPLQDFHRKAETPEPGRSDEETPLNTPPPRTPTPPKDSTREESEVSGPSRASSPELQQGCKVPLISGDSDSAGSCSILLKT